MDKKTFEITLWKNYNCKSFINRAVLPNGAIISVDQMGSYTGNNYVISQELNDKIALHMLTTNTCYEITKFELVSTLKISELEEEIEKLTKQLEGGK